MNRSETCRRHENGAGPLAATRVIVTLMPMLLCLPGQSFAQNPGVELTPMAGYRGGGEFRDPDTDETLELDEGGSYGLILNIDHDANTQWEFMFSHQPTELETGPAFVSEPRFDLDVTYFSAGGIYVWRDPKVEPFIGAGIGVTHMEPDDSRFDSETRVLVQLVGGYKIHLTDQIGLRIEARGYGTLLDSDAAVFCGNGACIARVESDGFGQAEVNAGLSLRF
jgi:opacity protein-like surface antigen